MTRSSGGSDLIEICVVSLLVLVAGTTIGRWSAPKPFIPRAEGNEAQVLFETYGPNRHSEHAEEWIIRDFYKDRRGGVFVDVGAYDYERLSNTYYLEKELGWSGVAIEPQVKFAADYARFRPRTTFEALFVSDYSDQITRLNVPAANDTVASASKQFADSYAKSDPVQVETVTLDDLLDRLKIPHVDFLTMDIELSEPAALRGFSVERFQPSLICVEAHPEVRQQILDYFARHDYTVVGKYLRADTSNLWFTPLTVTNRER